jgi:hypothetical protein
MMRRYVRGIAEMQAPTAEERYGPALEVALRAFARLEPRLAADRAGVAYEGDDGARRRFSVSFFGSLYTVEWPAGTVTREADGGGADIATSILLLHYLAAADGAPMGSEWMAFRNLPGGLGYEAAFRGRASRRLVRAFGSDAAGFERAARALGGESLSFGDRSFQFRALPRVWLAVVLHMADEFPAEVNVLFDAAARHYLPTEDLAVLGGMLAGRLIQAGRRP